MEILIVGAGPTGLLLAIELARRGVQFRIVDRNAGRSRLSKAMVVQVRTLEIYDALEIAAEAVAAGHPFTAAEFHLQGAHPLVVKFDALDSPFPHPLVLEQSENERILEEKLAALGRRVERGTELLSAEAVGKRYRVVLRTGAGERSAETDLVIGCDGASSTVRRIGNFPFVGSTYRDQFILGDVGVEWPYDHDRVRGFVSDAGLLVAFPMPGSGRYRLIGVRRDHRARGDPTLAEFAAAAEALVPVPVRIHTPRWFSHYRVHCRGVPQYTRGGLLLAGDAAHVHSPAGGQGMNTGLQDAWNLGWKVARVAAGMSDPAILDTYDQERRPFGEFLLARTDTAFRAMLDAGPAVRLFRRLVLPGLARRRWVQRRIAPLVSQLGIRYAAGPLVDSTSGFRPAALRPGRPRAGERAPDAPYRDPGGAARRIFQDLRGTGYHLYLLGGAGRDAKEQHAPLPRHRNDAVHVHQVAPPSAAVDAVPPLAAKYRLPPGGYLLVRPDGYIASMGPRERIDGAIRILNT